MVKKAIIVTPTSLVSNWEAEIKKWVGERVQLVALCESTRDDVVFGIDSFTSPHSPLQVNPCNYFGNFIELCTNWTMLQVLIVSYETFRMHSSKFSHSGSCDLLICDEAHRLKNDQTLTNRVSFSEVIFFFLVSQCVVSSPFLWVLFMDSFSFLDQALAALACKRRILLSGTPMQVRGVHSWFMICLMLSSFFSLIHFFYKKK